MDNYHENIRPEGPPVQGWKRPRKRIALPPGYPSTTDFIRADRDDDAGFALILKKFRESRRPGSDVTKGEMEK
jgi:hypothetical protein